MKGLSIYGALKNACKVLNCDFEAIKELLILNSPCHHVDNKE